MGGPTDYYSYISQVPSVASGLASDNPGKAIGNLALKIGAKEGIKYLGNQTGFTDWLTSGLSDIFGIGAGSGIGGATGVGGGLAPEIAGAAFEGAGSGLAGGAEGAIGGAASGASMGAGLPFAAATAILSNILMDEINDPKGRVSAAQDYNDLNAKSVPSFIKAMQVGSSALPLINNDLTDDQAALAFHAGRGGLKASQLMADPLANQGKREAGVPFINFGNNIAGNTANAGPASWLSAVRAQDILENRGHTDPNEALYNVPIGGPLYGRPDINTLDDEHKIFEQNAFPHGREGWAGPEGTLHLRPDEAYAAIGTGKDQPLNIADWGLADGNPYGIHDDNGVLKFGDGTEFFGENGQPNRSPHVLYRPDVMQDLDAIQPGHMEEGISNLLKKRGAYAGSPLERLENAVPLPPDTNVGE